MCIIHPYDTWSIGVDTSSNTDSHSPDMSYTAEIVMRMSLPIVPFHLRCFGILNIPFWSLITWKDVEFMPPIARVILRLAACVGSHVAY